MKRRGIPSSGLLLSLPKYLLVIILLLSFSSRSFSQYLTYTFISSNSGYSPVAGTQVFGAHADDEISTAIPIGFAFHFDDSLFNNLYISSNGFISFNENASDSYVNGLSTVGGTNLAPLIAPLWDDLEVSNGGAVQYQLSGVAPYRVLTIEWTNMEWNFNAQKGVINFQVKLYETINNIEFLYKDNGFTVNTGNASVGLAGKNAGVFVSVSDLSSTPVVSAIAEVNTVNNKPTTGQAFIWQTNGIVPLTLLSFTASYQKESVQLNWTCSNEKNTSYFEIMYSKDGRNFESAAQVKAIGNTVGSSQYHFNHNLTYSGLAYYKIKMVDADGKFIYSYTRQVYGSGKSNITIPNPIHNIIPIRFNSSAGLYMVSLYTRDGQLLQAIPVNITSEQQDVLLPIRHAQQGIYLIRVNPQDGKPGYTLKVINK